MSTHFSAIGFKIKSVADLSKLAQHAFENGTSFEVAGGKYICWQDESGAELWVQLDGNNEIIGMNPHFAGKAHMRVGLIGKFSLSNDFPFDGAFHAWANPEKGDPMKGIYPFVFASPNFLTHQLEFPQIADIQLLAIPDEFQAYSDEAAYRNSKLHLKLPFAPEAFIPTGSFNPQGEANDTPTAHGYLTGKVMECSILRNSYTRAKYQWALVRTLGGEIDVVKEHGLFSKPLREGNIIAGQFWLSGKVRGV